MIEAIMASEFYAILMIIGPWLAGVFGAIATAAIAIHKVAQVINEFRSSNELAQYNKQMSEYMADNRKLHKELIELKDAVKGRHQPGYTDDKED